MYFEIDKSIGIFSGGLNKHNSNSLAWLNPCKLKSHPHLLSGLDLELCISSIINITK